MKNDIQEIFSARLSQARNTVQTAFLIFCLWTGWQFFCFFEWASGQSTHFVQRPPAVEAFLPISALVGLKHLLQTGNFDPVHPAGLTILLAILAMSLLFRKGFCGWICPVGAVSNLVEKLSRKAGVLFRLPAWMDIPLLGLKYLLLGFFVYFIFLKMAPDQIEAFMTSPYNIAADAEMLQFFLFPSMTSAMMISGLVLISFFLRNFWCRYLCPYGALLGIIAMAGPIQIRRDRDSCTGCKRCERACPSSIKITARKTVRTTECIGCMECVSNCPEKDCLVPGLPLEKKAPLWLIPAGCLAVLLVFWAVARLTGHWQSHVPAQVFKQVYHIRHLVP